MRQSDKRRDLRDHNMKLNTNHTKRHTTPEMESLRDQMQHLNAELQDMQERFADLEDNENPWDIWPYSWAIFGWQKTRECFHSVQCSMAERAVRERESGEAESGDRPMLRLT